jgi:ankyrin repeat protein
MMHFTPRPELPIVALDLAVQHQRLDVIHVLLENGADVNACRDDGNTVLLYAVKVKLPEMIQVVLEHGANMNVCDANGDTVLSYALKNKLPEVIQMALAHGADVNARNREGETALHRLVRISDREAFEILMRHGADVNARDSYGRTSLMFAVQHVQMAMLEAVTERALQMNSKDGDRSLHHASLSSTTEETDTPYSLLQHGVDTDVRGYKVEPLFTAAVSNQVYGIENVQVLLRHGADVNASDNCKRTALHMVVQRLDVVIVGNILRNNANVNAREDRDDTPLMQAVSENQTANTSVIELLLKNGADVNAADHSETTALRVAVAFGNVEETKMLLIHGADVYSRKQGKRSIMEIAQTKANKVIMRLLAYFADVPPSARFEAASAVEYQDWWKEYVD